MGDFYNPLGGYNAYGIPDRPSPYVPIPEAGTQFMLMPCLKQKLQALTEKRYEKQQLEAACRQVDAEISVLQKDVAQSNRMGGGYERY